MEDFEFINFQPAKDLIQKGLRRAGSPVRKGFGAGKKIAGKAASGLMGGSKLRKIHHGALRESVAKNSMIKNRYESMGNYYIGQGAGGLAKNKISGVSSRNVKKANQVSQRGRASGQTTTARRASSGPMYIKGTLLPKAFNSIEATTHLDEMLGEAIEFSPLAKASDAVLRTTVLAPAINRSLPRILRGIPLPQASDTTVRLYGQGMQSIVGKKLKVARKAKPLGPHATSAPKIPRKRRHKASENPPVRKSQRDKDINYNDASDRRIDRLGTRGHRKGHRKREHDRKTIRKEHLEAKLDEAIELSRKPAKTVKDLSQKKISQIKTGELFKALQKIL
jgi:hypothetical protein